MMTRRRVLATSLAAAAASALGLSPALALGAPIGAIRVAFAPKVVAAWGDNTALVRAELERTLAEILGPALQRGAPNRLVVTISSLWLAAYAGGGGGGKPTDGGGSGDYLESVASVYDRSGRQIASWSILSTESSSAGGAWYRPDVDQRRLQALARNNAWWIKRYLEG